MSLFHLLILTTSIFSVYSVITRTPNGDILGFTSNYTDIYLGIRYGQLSIRWSPATLPKPWNDTLNATEFGPICYQFGPYKQPQPMVESEDCLFLNIWVPKTNNSLLPVRVWLHGGGYTAGYSNDYDSENLAYFSQSIIITINYRLGLFGFFPLPNLTTRNLGWIDQQLALQWIQENIPSFGGDKTNIMLFGQSAGGGSVLAHLIMESSWSLYSSLVLESAGPFVLADCKENEKINLKLLENAFPQCQSNITCFQELNPSRFYQELTVNWITLWPCIGEQSQLQEQPITLIRKGYFNKKTNILGGFNANEGQSAAFTFNQFNMSISSTRYYYLTEQYQIPSELIHRYDPTATDKDYFNAFSWLFGDYFINCPSLYLFNHLATISSSSIYVYFFIHPTENWAFTPLHFNATHLTEIPYVFHNHFAFTELTLAETDLSLKVIDYFTSFHLSKQPWPSYQINQTILLLNTGNDGMKIQFNFDQQLIEKCSIILKYLDSDDCHAYLNEQECLNITHCQWLGDYCDEIPTSSAQQYRFSFLGLFLFYVSFILLK
jgi:para-nitrobenzyl esterase